MRDPLPPERKRARADARRSEDALLDAAKKLFEEVGVEAPVRDIAAAAGVGMGTLYRSFPKRSDLVAAVFRREIDSCTAAAVTLLESHPAGDALALWLDRYAAFLATKKGLATALHSGDPAFEALPAHFRESFEPALTMLLDRAALASAIRDGVMAYDLLRAIGNLSAATGKDGADHVRRMLALMLDGMRVGAVRSADQTATS